MGTRGVRPPDPHPSGVKPPDIPPDLVPRHVALVMDGDGRWAGKRGLPRTEGHKQGESSLLDVIMGAIELGIPYLSAYAFSTENWRRSPDEVRFLMGFNRDVIHRRRDLLNEMGVRIEDSFLMEADGVRNLSGALPKTVKDVEGLMRERHSTSGGR